MFTARTVRLLVPSAAALWTSALGLWGLSRQNSVWRDEAATWQVARRSTAEIAQLLGNVDVVHGLYYLLMHGLFELFGPGTTVLRLPSVAATAVAAACVAALGHRLAGPWAGLGGGLALGLLPAVQFYLQEGRPYALVAAGAGVSTLLLVTLLEGRGRAVLWIAYSGTVALCGLLNWLSLMILPAHLLTLLLSGRGGRRRHDLGGLGKRWAAAAGAAVVCVLPLVLFSRSQSAQVSWIPPLTWHMLIGPAVLLAVGGAGALLDRRSPRRPDGLSAAAVGLPLLVVPHLGLAGLSLIQPLFLDRYVLFSLLGLALLIGAAIGVAVRTVSRRLPRAGWWFLPAIVAVAAVALLPQALAKRSPASRVDDVLAAADDVRRLKRPGDAVLFFPSARRDTRLVSPDAFSGLEDIALARTPERSGTLKGVEAEPARIRAAMLTHRRILLVTDAPAVSRPPATERDRMKRSVLRNHFRIVTDTQTRGRRVTLYERRV
ncbi:MULTISPECIES: glycosyltransferase family 39 protein [unclassified Streptomyces]|uniref:glycosyltransferase family 39 protein n=1 Tax=Streptomyces TaxID=1883 RepID=UPI000FD76703|nr:MULTISPECIES: glycosyltransferase family 39 protein [unclassified Streptomyces]UQA34492.1 glycosyltransferase family 39 protein [Streptomyces sp. HNA39]